jgi:hypothetical protein
MSLHGNIYGMNSLMLACLFGSGGVKLSRWEREVTVSFWRQSFIFVFVAYSFIRYSFMLGSLLLYFTLLRICCISVGA